MTGAELRAFLVQWNISRAMFSDALALIGYRVEAEHVTRWGDTVPATAKRLIEEWREHPERRPVRIKRAAVIQVTRHKRSA